MAKKKPDVPISDETLRSLIDQLDMVEDKLHGLMGEVKSVRLALLRRLRYTNLD